jgi:hypothetical protein
MEIRSFLHPFDTFYGNLVYFMVIGYIFPRFGILCQDKYGNPENDDLLMRCGGFF